MDALTILTAGTMFLILGIGLFANIGVAYVVKKHREETALGTILGWLVIADLSVILVKAFGSITCNLAKPHQPPNPKCSTYELAYYISHSVMMATLIVLVIDRVIVLNFWTFYNKGITKQLMNRVLCPLWLAIALVLLIAWWNFPDDREQFLRRPAMSNFPNNNSHRTNVTMADILLSTWRLNNLKLLSICQASVGAGLILISCVNLWKIRCIRLKQGFRGNHSIAEHSQKEMPPSMHHRGAKVVAVSTIIQNAVTIVEALLLLIANFIQNYQMTYVVGLLLGAVGVMSRPVLIIALSRPFRRTMATGFARKPRRVASSFPEFRTNFNIEHCLRVDANQIVVPWYLRKNTADTSVSRNMQISFISELAEVDYGRTNGLKGVGIERRLSIRSTLSIGSVEDAADFVQPDQGSSDTLNSVFGIVAPLSPSANEQDRRQRNHVVHRVSLSSTTSHTDAKGMLNPNVTRRSTFTFPSIEMNVLSQPSPLHGVRRQSSDCVFRYDQNK